MNTTKTKNVIKYIKRIFIVCVCLGAVGVAALFGIDTYVKGNVKSSIITLEQAMQLDAVDCIVVLGCGVWSDGTPSHMLEDRLKMSIELYEKSAAPKIIMSGDHGRTDYNEVKVMKKYAVDRDVPSQNVFMDHAGFSTYDSVYRAKEVFCASKVIIVTQEYHLYRALYIAQSLGMEAYGVAADYRTYRGQILRDAREVLARVKDCAKCIFKPKSTYCGDAIPVEGNGDVTNDYDY